MSKEIRAAGLWIGLVLLGASVGGCTSEAAIHEERGTYEATHPLRTDTALTREYVAQVRAIQHIEVRALERGYLEEIAIDEGQHVEEGTLMFRIMPVLYQAELSKASAEAEFAEIEFKNTKALQDGNVVSENELALAKAKLDKANAERRLARVHVDLTSIKAPFDGIMGRLEVRKGSLLEEGELLTTLSDNSKMWVYFNVSEAEYLDYKGRAGKDMLPVKLRMANGKTFDHEGKIETIEADFNNETGNIAFRATFENPDGLLRHGETGTIVMSTPLPNALLIPQKATFDILDKRFVFVVDGEGTAHLREIKVSEELPHLYVVASGLTETDQILLEGQRKVRDGGEVSIEMKEPQAVIAELDELEAE